MNKKHLQSIADGMGTYVLANEPQTLDTLHERARGKEWYTENVFYDVMSLLGKDPRLSVKTESDGSGITFRKRRVVVRTKPTMAQQMEERARVPRAMYPEEDIQPEDIPFKACHCAVFHVHWHNSMGHWPDCDAIRFATEYAEQNPWDTTVNKLIDQEAYGKERARHTAVNNSRTRKPKHLLLATQQ